MSRKTSIPSFLKKIEKNYNTQRAENNLAFGVSSGAELIASLEDLANRIIAKPSPDKQSSEIHIQAQEMLSRLRWVRHWATQGEMDAAIRETILAMAEFAYLKNVEIGPEYILGLKHKRGTQKAALITAKRKKEIIEPKRNQIRDITKKELAQGRKRSEIIKNLARKFDYDESHIRLILRKSDI